MLLYLNIILTLLLGLIIGLNLKQISFTKAFPQYTLIRHDSSSPKPVEVGTLNPQTDQQKQDHCFDILEVRVLSRIINPNEPKLDVKSLNHLTNLTNLSPENQRQRRHLFLKELNLKLFLIFNIRESIIRYDDENDKRIKIYKLSDQISPDMISKALNTEA
jgi:hypothetical protein